jgi:alkaline phosphatase
MGKKTVSAYVETEVDVDLDMFHESDLIEHLEDNGYTVVEGKFEVKKIKALDKQIWGLYQAFLLDNGDNNDFDMELRKFFAEYYDKVNV